MTISVKGIFETHIRVKDVECSAKFYQEVVGLKLAFENKNRGVIFLWVGEGKTSMLGLWGDNSINAPISTGKSHFAFKVDPIQFEAIFNELRRHNVTPLDFYGQPTDEPVVIGWVPNLSIYFADPDGHSVEFLAVLSELPKPEIGIVKYSEWKNQYNKEIHADKQS